MEFKQAVVRNLTQPAIFDFKGKASRSEFWYFLLFTVLAKFVLNLVAVLFFFTGPELLSYLVTALGGLASLLLLIPATATWVRRLHDSGRSGWNMCWVLLPGIGVLVCLYQLCQPSLEEIEGQRLTPASDQAEQTSPQPGSQEA